MKSEAWTHPVTLQAHRSRRGGQMLFLGPHPRKTTWVLSHIPKPSLGYRLAPPGQLSDFVIRNLNQTCGDKEATRTHSVNTLVENFRINYVINVSNKIRVI